MVDSYACGTCGKALSECDAYTGLVTISAGEYEKLRKALGKIASGMSNAGGIGHTLSVEDTRRIARGAL